MSLFIITLQLTFRHLVKKAILYKIIIVISTSVDYNVFDFVFINFFNPNNFLIIVAMCSKTIQLYYLYTEYVI